MGGDTEVKETADQIQEQKNNTELWNYSQQVYKPFLDKYIAKSTANASSDAQAKKAEGQVNAEVMKSASIMKPGAGNPIATTKKLDTAANIESAAMTEADGKVRQQQLNSLQNIVDIGRGQATDANTLQGNIAEQSLQTAIKDKQSDLQTQGVIENSIGSAIGAGASAYKRYMQPSVSGQAFNPSVALGSGDSTIDEQLGLGTYSNTSKILNPQNPW